MIARQPEDEEIKKSPFVFLMNKAKMESMLRQDPAFNREETLKDARGDQQFLKMPQSFSMFNRQTEYPFDPVPNVFKLAPGGDPAGQGTEEGSQ